MKKSIHILFVVISSLVVVISAFNIKRSSNKDLPPCRGCNKNTLGEYCCNGKDEYRCRENQTGVYRYELTARNVCGQ